jgi:uncharacterized Zn-binding protein involved in type VI secretion
MAQPAATCDATKVWSWVGNASKTLAWKIIASGPHKINIGAQGGYVALHGDLVESHGAPPHDAATLVANPATKMNDNGRKVIKKGDSASCGHTVQSIVTKLSV